jgi:DNA protecting protein DprA
MNILSGRWLALSRASGRLDPRAVLQHVGGRKGLEEATLRELMEAGLPAGLAQTVLETPPLSFEASCWRIGDADYPAALLDLPHPPAVVWYQGNAERLEAPAVSLVGARRCTQRGRDTASLLARSVVEAGGVVVSGGARGIDHAAHLGAGGQTVVVLGGGLRSSRSHAADQLFQDILSQGGLLLTEVPPGDPTFPFHFPRRNRLIAALGRGCVVIEAAQRSGARITARLALELGRDVAAVPGSMSAPTSAGCLRLIADGARCLCSIAEVVELLGIEGVGVVRSADIPETVSQIAARMGKQPGEVLRLLAVWEVTGAARRAAGGLWWVNSCGASSSGAGSGASSPGGPSLPRD